MNFIIVFFLVFAQFGLSAADLPCDLVRKDPSYSIGYIKNSKGFCSGVLVTPHLVLTAGHCVKGEEARGVKFSLSASTNATFASSKKLVQHPSYWKARDGTSGGLDLALLVLESTEYGSVPGIFLPIVASNDLPVGETLVSWGFGLQDGGDFARRHKKAVVLSGREGSISADGKTVKEARLVFKRGDTGEIQCSGDSGGPVLLEREGRFRVVGINSRSAANISYSSKQGLQRKLASKEYFCHHSDKFMSANVGLVIGWIEENIKIHETDKNPARCGKG